MVLKTPILFKISSILVLILLLIIVISTLFGYSSSDISLSQLIDSFSNTPELAELSDISEVTNALNKALDTITIPDNVTSISGLQSFFTFINSITSFLFGIINFSITLVQMISIIFTFIQYVFTAFFV